MVRASPGSYSCRRKHSLVRERVQTGPRRRRPGLRAALTVAVQRGGQQQEQEEAAAAGQRAQDQRRAEELSPDSPWKKAGLVAVASGAAPASAEPEH